jgi:hypothetical protein
MESADARGGGASVGDGNAGSSSGPARERLPDRFAQKPWGGAPGTPVEPGRVEGAIGARESSGGGAAKPGYRVTVTAARGSARGSAVGGRGSPFASAAGRGGRGTGRPSFGAPGDSGGSGSWAPVAQEEGEEAPHSYPHRSPALGERVGEGDGSVGLRFGLGRSASQPDASVLRAAADSPADSSGPVNMQAAAYSASAAHPRHDAGQSLTQREEDGPASSAAGTGARDIIDAGNSGSSSSLARGGDDGAVIGASESAAQRTWGLQHGSSSLDRHVAPLSGSEQGPSDRPTLPPSDASAAQLDQPHGWRQGIAGGGAADLQAQPDGLDRLLHPLQGERPARSSSRDRSRERAGPAAGDTGGHRRASGRESRSGLEAGQGSHDMPRFRGRVSVDRFASGGRLDASEGASTGLGRFGGDRPGGAGDVLAASSSGSAAAQGGEAAAERTGAHDRPPQPGDEAGWRGEQGRAADAALSRQDRRDIRAGPAPSEGGDFAPDGRGRGFAGTSGDAARHWGAAAGPHPQEAPRHPQQQQPPPPHGRADGGRGDYRYPPPPAAAGEHRERGGREGPPPPHGPPFGQQERHYSGHDDRYDGRGPPLSQQLHPHLRHGDGRFDPRAAVAAEAEHHHRMMMADRQGAMGGESGFGRPLPPPPHGGFGGFDGDPFHGPPGAAGGRGGRGGGRGGGREGPPRPFFFDGPYPPDFAGGGPPPGDFFGGPPPRHMLPPPPFPDGPHAPPYGGPPPGFHDRRDMLMGPPPPDFRGDARMLPPHPHPHAPPPHGHGGFPPYEGFPPPPPLPHGQQHHYGPFPQPPFGPHGAGGPPSFHPHPDAGGAPGSGSMERQEGEGCPGTGGGGDGASVASGAEGRGMAVDDAEGPGGGAGAGGSWRGGRGRGRGRYSTPFSTRTESDGGKAAAAGSSTAGDAAASPGGVTAAEAAGAGGASKATAVSVYRTAAEAGKLAEAESAYKAALLAAEVARMRARQSGAVAAAMLQSLDASLGSDTAPSGAPSSGAMAP